MSVKCGGGESNSYDSGFKSEMFASYITPAYSIVGSGSVLIVTEKAGKMPALPGHHCRKKIGCAIRTRTGRFRVYEAREPLLLHSRVKTPGRGSNPSIAVLRTAPLPIGFPAFRKRMKGIEPL